MPIRCIFGLHKWKLNRPIELIDAFPETLEHNMKYKHPTRECIRKECDKKQKWLPEFDGIKAGWWTIYDAKEDV